MPDIAMCQNRKCPKRFGCYRFCAVPDPIRQCYGDFIYSRKCDYFTPNQRTYTLRDLSKEKHEE